ncbi:MAG: hypothetical protein Q8M98_07390 [Candidatus Cloacimonadaceae bacterium]|nr:hypothetical protein [Candidatus Cloacimonadaceae bacterium]MDP3114586.1 hypothetical protein [Candidatus Cloacimonadaceae bacterium]
MPNPKKDRLHLGKINFLLLALVALLLVIGYFVMSLNDIIVSPVLLGIVYVILIPFALLYKAKPGN